VLRMSKSVALLCVIRAIIELSVLNEAVAGERATVSQSRESARVEQFPLFRELSEKHGAMVLLSLVWRVRGTTNGVASNVARFV